MIYEISLAAAAAAAAGAGDDALLLTQNVGLGPEW